jgi:hypothetical protein
MPPNSPDSAPATARTIPGPAQLVGIEDRRKAAAGGTWPWGIPVDSKLSWSRPYPCPRACAHVYLGGGREAAGGWRQIRAGGRNEWRFRDGAAVMSVAGRAGASNGYSFAPLDVATDRYTKLRVKLSGSENARFYIDAMGEGGDTVFASKWQETPVEPREITFDLPPNRRIRRIVLYTWTEDGKPAENRFTDVTFVGEKDQVPVALAAAGKAGDAGGTLDIRRGVARVRNPGPAGGETLVRALAQRNALLISAPGVAVLEPIPFDPPAQTAVTDQAVQWVKQTFPGDADWPGMSFAVALAQQGERKAVAVVTSLESRDIIAAAVAMAAKTLADDARTLIAEHEKAWDAFWSASGVDLDDPFLRNVWYRNLYFLRCVSKPGVEAVGLYAGLVNDRPAWHGGHTTNYNAEQTFWAPYVSNHPELGEPYERLIHRYLPRARWFARKAYGCGGAFYPHNLFAYEPPDPDRCKSPNGRMHVYSPWGYTIGVSGFAVQNLWWHHKYYPADRAYLKTIAYPAVRDVALFYADFMDHCERDGAGRVILAPSVSPEHWGWTSNWSRNRNCTFDIAFAHFTFDAAIEGARTLGCDADLARRWQAAIGRMPPYPTTGGDRPVVIDVADAPPITYNIAVPAVPVFPAGVVTYFSPDEQKHLFARTIEQIKWNGNNSAVILPAARARLSMPAAWQSMKAEFQARSRSNGTLTLNRLGHGINNHGHYTEQFAATMAVSELLLQSVGDVLRVFPAWPADKAARFERLRAQGGFVVSAEQADRRVRQVRVTATVGGPLRLLSPWPTVTVESSLRRAVATAPDARGIIEVQTQTNETLTLRRGRE